MVYTRSIQIRVSREQHETIHRLETILPGFRSAKKVPIPEGFKTPEARSAYEALGTDTLLAALHFWAPEDERCRSCYGGFTAKCQRCRG